MQEMCQEDIVIVGAGIAGLATALGLHRLRIACVVLESSEGLRVSGFALNMWTNAWRALDALGVGDSLRETSFLIQGFEISSKNSKQSSSKEDQEADIKFGNYESRCVKRRTLLETLLKELPKGMVRYSSKVVCIEESGNLKLLHLTDGSVIPTKVLIGCDGVNSVVAKWVGLQSPVSVGRASIRGFVDYPDGHGFEPKFHAFFGGGVRYGFVPCDPKCVYWFCTFKTSLFKYDENEHDPLKLKQFVTTSICNVPKYASDIVDATGLESICCNVLKFRYPCNILLGSIVKNNVCVAGDALHPMTPDIGQGGCLSLEDSVILARCLGEALLSEPTSSDKKLGDKEQHANVEKGLQKYAKTRRWRGFRLVGIAYIVGMMQQSNNTVVVWLRKILMSKYKIGDVILRMSDFDCGKLCESSSNQTF